MSESKIKEAMIDAHDALPNGVYLVMVFEKGMNDPVFHAIFSTMELAKEWMDSRPPQCTCLCAPFVIDSPDYGNVPKGEMQ